MVLAAGLAMSAMLSGCGTTTEPGGEVVGDDNDVKIEISYVTWKADHPMQVMVKELITSIEEKSKGQITFVHKGDEETIAPADQMEAVQDGVIDAGMTGMSALASQIPIVNAGSAIPLTTQEQRKVGITDIFQKNFEASGLHYICNLDSSDYSSQFRLWLNKEIKTPEELKGLKLRTINQYAALAEHYGATPLNIPAPDLYTSVQQGLVNGYFLSFQAVDLGLGEVTDWFIDPGFGTSDEVFYINLDKWNEIPANLQKLIEDEVNATEKAWESKWDAERAKQKQNVIDKGVKELKLEEKVGEEFVAEYNDLVWAEVIGLAGDDAKKIRELCGLPPLQ
jgi:TRAP-type C4-dicarboxylate transport system substrate-binding protein